MTSPGDEFGFETPLDSAFAPWLFGATDPAQVPVEAPEPVDAVKAEVALFCAADAFPELTDAHLSAVVAKAARPDAYGRGIRDPQWVPTYNVTYAIWQGWKLKAALAAGAYDFQTDKTVLSRSQVRTACLEMAREWAKRIRSSVAQPVPRTTTLLPPPVEPPYGAGPVIY